jgi:hypothetical protein
MIKHSSTGRRLAAVALATSVVGFAAGAHAGWPAGQLRTIAGQSCTPFTIPIDASESLCPFVSDYVSEGDSFLSLDNQTIYIDYQVSSSASGKWTAISPCRQSWTGAAAVCSGGVMEMDGTTGFKDEGMYGFAGVAGTDPSDYYYVSVITTEVIHNILGVYFG